jgi:ADP-heptose:LPS heptosyltransferase
MPGVEKVIASGADLPEFDYHCAVGTLPMVFKTTMQTIPADVPYIRADADLSGQWKKRLGGMGARLKVGMCWAGNPRNTNDRFRSMSVENLAPIAAAQHETGILFFSLQKGIGVKIGPTTMAEGSSGKLGLTDFTAELRDFADTSALIDNLDLVISVDTAVAHLAGAMGKRTWLPLSTAADWRYFKDRDDSPWYPTMRLFRQTSPGDWTGPVNAIATELAELAKRPAQ